MPELPKTYSDHWLELARQFEDSHDGARVVNPRNIYARSLLEFDKAWMDDLWRWREIIRYQRDRGKLASLLP